MKHVLKILGISIKILALMTMFSFAAMKAFSQGGVKWKGVIDNKPTTGYFLPSVKVYAVTNQATGGASGFAMSAETDSCLWYFSKAAGMYSINTVAAGFSLQHGINGLSMKFAGSQFVSSSRYWLNGTAMIGSDTVAGLAYINPTGGFRHIISVKPDRLSMSYNQNLSGSGDFSTFSIDNNRVKMSYKTVSKNNYITITSDSLGFYLHGQLAGWIDTSGLFRISRAKFDTTYYSDGTYWTSADGRGVINVNGANYFMQDYDRVISDSAVTFDTIYMPSNPTPGWMRTVIQTNGGTGYSVISGNGKRIHLSWQYYKVSSTNPTTLIYNQDRDKYEFISQRIDAMGIDTNSLPTDDLILWLSADSLNLTNNDPVASWTDKSGSGNNFTQGTATNQPTYKTNQVNSKPAVLFDGTNDFMSLSGMYDGLGYMTMVVLKKYDGSSPMGLFYNGSMQVDVNASNQYQFYDFTTGCGVAQVNSVDLSAWTILSYRIATDTVYLYINGELYGKDNIGTCNPAWDTFGQQYPTTYMHGYVAEIIHYNSTDPAILRRANQYLANKYNIH